MVGPVRWLRPVWDWSRPTIRPSLQPHPDMSISDKDTRDRELADHQKKLQHNVAKTSLLLSNQTLKRNSVPRTSQLCPVRRAEARQRLPQPMPTF